MVQKLVESVLRDDDEKETSDARAVGPSRRVQIHRGKRRSDEDGADRGFVRKVSEGMIETGSSARGVV